jgi:hypothetical protein
VDNSPVLTRATYIYPRVGAVGLVASNTSVPIAPFYQWENNNGYCGEVSAIQAGMLNGQFMSQFHARRICGATLDRWPTGANPPVAAVLPAKPPHAYPNPIPWTVGVSLEQAGPRPTASSGLGADAWCSLFGTPNYNSQQEYETPNPGQVSGPNDYAHSNLCLSNAQLDASLYDYANQPTGAAGYRQFMQWIKAEVIAGNVVSIGVLWGSKYGGDSEYDHEVTVTRIGTNYPLSDTSYHPDDVLYIDDHGLMNASLKTPHKIGVANSAVPPGASAGDAYCTPYEYGYTFGDPAHPAFGSWPNTRSGANSSGQEYSIVIPGAAGATQQGTDGYKSMAPITTRDFGFSVTYAHEDTQDTDPVRCAGVSNLSLLPVVVSIASSATASVTNPRDIFAGFNYENPFIGTDIYGAGCTNTQPAAMTLALNVDVSGLVSGVAYNLYEYDFSGVSGVGSGAALNMPACKFNANAALAQKKTTFTASGPSYHATASNKRSDQIIVFRAVPASAP